MVFAPGSLNGDSYGSIRKLIGFTDEFFYTVFDGVIEAPAFNIAPILMKAKSRGRIMLKSRSPFSWPSMQPGYYTDPEDLHRMVQGVKLGVQLAESQPFRQFGARLHNRPYPGCEQVPFRSDSYWECLLVNYGSSLQHVSDVSQL